MSVQDQATGGTQQEGSTRPEPGGKAAEGRETVSFAEPTFASHVLMVAASVSMLLGETPNPVTQKTERDLNMARHSIDTLAMLKEKTKGNLDGQETALLDDLLFSLRMRFVEILNQEEKEGKEKKE